MSDVVNVTAKTRPPRLAGKPPARGGNELAGFEFGGDHVDDQIAAYALGALDGDERDLVERHCRACARCSRMADDERRLISFLPLAVPLAVPSPDVKLALFARVAQSQIHGSHRTHRGIDPGVKDAPRGPLPPTLTIPASRPAVPALAATAPSPLAAERRRARWTGAALSLPLLAALLATGAWGLQLREQVAERTGQVSRLEESIANFGAFGSRLSLEGEQGQGELRISADEQEAVLRVQLNEPKADMSYRLLGLNRDGEVVPISELEVDDEGNGLIPIDLKRSIGEYRTLQVVARSDGSDAGSGESVMSGQPNGSIGSDDPTANSAVPDS